MLFEVLKEAVEGSESSSGHRGHLPGRQSKLKRWRSGCVGPVGQQW